MNSNIKLGRIIGIPVGLHWSWFLIFFLVTFSLAQGLFQANSAAVGQVAGLAVAAGTALMLFASVLAHEFGHAVVSIRNGIPVRQITLFIFGGVAQIEQEPDRPGVEFRIAIAGPLVSLGLAAVFAAAAWVSQPLQIFSASARWLAEVNLTLALFNMIPGFPLDGGRVLRSIVWAVKRDFKKATRFATSTGQIIAFGFMGFGIYFISTGGFANGMWLMFIGWFLHNAASVSKQQVETMEPLREIRAVQVMDRQISQIPSYLTIDHLVNDQIVNGGQRSFLVEGSSGPLGLITIRDIVSIPRPQWPTTPVSAVMVPWDRLVHVTPDTALLSVLQAMDLTKTGLVPVVESGRVEGMLTREQIVHYLKTRQELGL